MTEPHPRYTVSQVARLLREADLDELPAIMDRFAPDQRRGVADALAAARRRCERHLAEVRRVEALFDMERDLHARGFAVVAGVDEVGRGALAGPVTAGAVVLETDVFIFGLDDSKRLTPAQREKTAALIHAAAMAVAVAHVDAEQIDRMGIGAATRSAMRLALDALEVPVAHVLVDGNDAAIGAACTPIVNGDARCAAIAAASIVAKVARDRLMTELASRYPIYGFDAHKGYSTPEHVAAIRRHGPSDVHRRSFEPCREAPTLF